MVTTTTQYSFQKPTVGDDEDAWGGYLNSNFDSIDSLLRGATSLSSLSLTGNITFGDNDKAIFGAGSDLQIYHDGGHSYISDQGTGNLHIIASNETYIANAGNSEYIARFITDGAVELYYDAVKKFETTSTGIDVTGTVTTDGLTVDESNNVRYSFSESGTGHAYLTIRAGYNTKDSQITFSNNTNSTTGSINYDHTSNFMKFSTNGANERMRIASNGDISFYEDTGTTAKFFWDASAERLGIGSANASASIALHDANNYPYIHFNNASNTNIAYMGWHGGTGGEDTLMIGTTPSKDIVFETATTERMRVTSGGNVGIGTSSPSSYLNYRYLDVAGASSSQGGVVQVFTSGKETRAQFVADSNGVRLNTITNHSMSFHTNATERMKIDNSGRVMIGTTSASYPFTVQSTGTSTIHIKTTATNGFAQLFLENDAKMYSVGVGSLDQLYIYDNTAAANRLVINSSGFVGFGNYSPTHLLHLTSNTPYIAFEETDTSQKYSIGSGGGKFFVYDETDAAQRLTIDGSGNVGIGTSSPSEKLSVYPDSDNSAEIGRAHIGYIAYADWAGFSHVDRNFAGNYALLQNGSGQTIINCTSGQHLSFRQNNFVLMEQWASGLYNYSVYYEDYDALSGTSVTVNCDTAQGFSLTLSGNTTFTFNSVSSAWSYGFVLELTGHSTTAYTVDFGTNNNVKWAGGTAPDAPAAGETDIYVFWTRDGGTTWYGVHSIDAAS